MAKKKSKQKFRSLKDIDDAYILQIHVLCGWNKDANELVQSFLLMFTFYQSLPKARKQSPNKEMLPPAPCLPFRSAFSVTLISILPTHRCTLTSFLYSSEIFAMDQKFDYRLNTSEEYCSLIVLGLRLVAFKNSGANYRHSGWN